MQGSLSPRGSVFASVCVCVFGCFFFLFFYTVLCVSICVFTGKQFTRGAHALCVGPFHFQIERQKHLRGGSQLWRAVFRGAGECLCCVQTHTHTLSLSAGKSQDWPSGQEEEWLKIHHVKLRWGNHCFCKQSSASLTSGTIKSYRERKKKRDWGRRDRKAVDGVRIF